MACLSHLRKTRSDEFPGGTPYVGCDRCEVTRGKGPKYISVEGLRGESGGQTQEWSDRIHPHMVSQVRRIARGQCSESEGGHEPESAKPE